MNAKDYEAEMKWFSSSEAKQRSEAAKAHAISEFKKRFPRANISRFQEEVEFDPNRKATATVLFTESNGSQTDPLIKDQKYWSQPLKDALGMHQDGGFPAQLSLFIENKPQPVPAVDFSELITQSVADIFNKEMKIYVTPTEYFTTKFRQIFTKAQIKFTTSKYARKWLAKPNMSFWPQQLNFAVWCATTGFSLPPLILVNKFVHFISFTCAAQQEKYCMKWVESRVRTLCLTIRFLNRKIIPMMLHLTKGCVVNLVLIPVLISALHMGKIVD